MNNSQLPIHEYSTKIMEAIDNNRVLVISGRTGCGKSTQVPKYILAKYPNANIAVCQPRRLAATCLAQRVSEEYGIAIGNAVGYQIGMQSKSGEKTKIMYMTYGILIQQLLFQSTIEYTHIILDEVHERSLQMDFTFIALKKILDSQDKIKTKVIIMSATINSKQFAEHFSTHVKTQQFLKPIITYRSEQKRNGRSNRNRDQNSSQLCADIKFDTQDYKEAESIILPDKNKYKIFEYFADDIKNNKAIPQYVINQDVRVKEETFYLALDLIAEHMKKQKGDILVFVPGMFQIKYLKDKLIESAKVDPIQIIEVHSAYSEELYKKLFIDKIEQKVIIATNIGQSSITLPFCKTVVDFCLTRKNITIKIKGYSRFETRVASKANLMQRAGRVGRISDGIVYRLIPKDLYEKLEDFDIPEIQCVSLDMVILRAKQIDKTYNSNLFEDPYEVFFNAIEPPKFQQIHTAIEYLLQQEALVLVPSSKSSKEQTNHQKYNAKDLKITKTGQFMVTMPCNIRISKMILHSLELGITSTIVDIAAILLTQKQFFLHEEKRPNIEEWMHSIVGYDRGHYNDFLMRQRLFSHWRTLYYYQSFMNQRYKNKQKQKNNQGESQKILQLFNNQRITHTQWSWCNDRGVSPWVMRDILRISESIRIRLSQAQIRIERNMTQQVENELVLYCLCIAFEDTTCEIEWKLKNSYKKKEDIENYVSLIESEQFKDDDIHDFMEPVKKYKIEHQVGGFIKITGIPEVMSKLLLPRNYGKGLQGNTTKFYQYLASNPPKVSYTYQNNTVRERVRQVTVLNDSINKVNVRPDHNLDYMLITDKIFDSKGKYYMGACALVEKKILILLKMMTAKDVELEPHVSQEFYVRVVINKNTIQLPFLLRNQDIDIIKQFRKISQQQKSKKLEDPVLLENARRSKFYRLLTQTPLKPPLEEWTYIYNATVENYKRFQEFPIKIQQCRELREINQKQLGYFQRYKKWKVKQHDDLYLNFRLLTVKKGSIICSKCWPTHLTLIEDLESFCTQKKILKLNQYRGSWIQDRSTLMCSKKHKIGHALNADEGSIQYQSILMYCPKGKVAKFDGLQSSIQEMLSLVEQGVADLEVEKRKFYEFQCKVCSTYNEYQKLKRFILEKQNMDTQTFWKKITDHMYSKKHLDNLERFLQNV